MCSIFTGEHPCQSVISVKLLCNFIEITLWRGCSPVNLLHIFSTTFPKKTSGGLLLLEENLNHLTEIKIDLKCPTFGNFEKMLKSKGTHIEIAVTIAILILRFKTSKQKMLSIKRTFP